MKAETFDRKIDANEKIVDHLDREARRMSVTRQSLVKLWLADKLCQKAAGDRRSRQPTPLASAVGDDTVGWR